jgi:hypothetical protein
MPYTIDNDRICTNCTNIFIGNSTVGQSTIGSYNTFLGVSSGRCNTTSCSNAYFGPFTGYYSTGAGNSFFGAIAGSTQTTGSYNTFLGYNAGPGCLNQTTTGSYNVAIGYNATVSSGSVCNQVNIYGGTSVARFTQGATAWTFISDRRDKTNIIDLPVGRYFLRDIKPRKFQWNFRNSDYNRGDEASGFIAQEVLEIQEKHNSPYLGLVYSDDPNSYGVAAGSFIPILVNAVKELDEENISLKERVSLLESKVEELNNIVNGGN